MQNIRFSNPVAAIAGCGLAALNRASADLYATEDREMTLESLSDRAGSFSKMELRRKQSHETISRK